MQFCPKCGTILVQKTKRFGCSKCGYSSNNVKLIASEDLVNEQKISVLREKENNVWPTVNETCPKCGHDEAETWATQMRAGDEAETVFFRCKKCSTIWRERQ